MRQAAIYARYSDLEQRATSIDDQVRRAREKANQLGYTVADEHVYADAALTGAAKGLGKRAGYKRLVADWEKRSGFEVVIVDEISRLARDPVELAKIQERVERTRVRLVSCDGVDSTTPGWQLQFGLTSLIAQHFLRETRHRVIRGMQGQLERGYMIGYPPFGYRLIRVGASDNEGGTLWEIDEEQARWVRRAFELRYAGKAFGAIAEYLNREGVSSPRKPRKEAVAYWRPGTVKQLMSNPIYRGIFVWRGSGFFRAKANREGLVAEPVEYQRPQLALVPELVWKACNQPKGTSRLRGGGKHVFAGLVSCGVCHARLTVSTGGAVPTLYCAQCGQAKRVGVGGRQTSYVSARGLEKAVEYVLQQLLNDECVEAFRQRLRARLAGGHTGRIAELKVLLAKSDRSLERLAQMIRLLDEEDEVLASAYRAESNERKVLKVELESLEHARKALDTSAIERQLGVDPRQLVDRLFRTGSPVEAARAVLSRIFPRIVLVERPARYVSVWEFGICPGALMAQASETDTLIDDIELMRIRVESGPVRPTPWRVSEMERGRAKLSEESVV